MEMGGRMALARYVVDAVVLEGRGVREVARAHGVSKTWVSVLVARYRAGGYEALEPRSRRPHTRPNRTPVELEDEIVRLRKDLVEAGFDGGARTIHWHLSKRGRLPVDLDHLAGALASGLHRPRTEEASGHLVHPLRGRSAERVLAGRRDPLAAPTGRDVEILNFIDDHSRLIVAGRVLRITKAHDVVDTFDEARRWGYPASVLTDNGAIFNGGRVKAPPPSRPCSTSSGS